MPPSFDEKEFRHLYGHLSKEIPFTSPIDDINYLSTKVVDREEISRVKARVVIVKLYPGIDMRIYESLPMDTILILESYHSGTGPSSSIDSGIVALSQKRLDLKICLASIPSPIVSEPYAVSLILKEAGVLLFKDIPSHVLYAGALLGLAEGLSSSEALSRFSSLRV